MAAGYATRILGGQWGSREKHGKYDKFADTNQSTGATGDQNMSILPTPKKEPCKYRGCATECLRSFSAQIFQQFLCAGNIFPMGTAKFDGLPGVFFCG